MRAAGVTWKSKVNRTIEKLKEAKADLIVITALDETAWLFNLVSFIDFNFRSFLFMFIKSFQRSADIPYNPMFFSYAIVDVNGPPRYLIESLKK